MCRYIHTLWLLIFISVVKFTHGKWESTESQLSEHLLKNYNPQVRPPSSLAGNKTIVSMYMTLLQIISVKEKDEELTTSSYMTFSWEDPRLTWDPADFENIKVFRMPADEIWTPRIVLTNSKDGNFDVAFRVNTLISYTGAVEWLPPTLYKSSCSINVAIFPFDWQNCTLVFRSATYERDEMDFALTYPEIFVDPNAFQPNGEWDLIQKPVRVNTLPHDDMYVDVTFYFIIRRKPQFYVMNIIIPCLLLTVLSCFVFFLPSISCEKMTLSISILLGQTIFLFLIAQRMPETSLSVPLIGSYLLFSMILIVFCVIFSVIVCNLHFRTATTHEMPDWMRRVFIDKLAPMLNVVRPPPTSIWVKGTNARPRRANSLSSRKAIQERATWRAPSEILFDYQAKRYGFRTRHVQNENGFTEIRASENGSVPPNEIPASIRPVPKSLRPAVENIRYIAEHIKKDEEKEQIADDWAYVALILDRLMFWFYTVVFTVGSSAFFLRTTMEDYPQLK